MIPDGKARDGSGIPSGRFHGEPEKLSPFLQRLESIFEEMDAGYREVAAVYGFDCRGCEDSCCLTRFYHHTFLEFLNIQEGLKALAPTVRPAIFRRAQRVVAAYAEADRTGRKRPIMCPLNQSGRCELYVHRPMICRLHGIPHELHHPVRGVVVGPGCREFDTTGCQARDLRLDRTPFYAALASLEKELRAAMDLRLKIRLTVADMVVLTQGNQNS